MRKSRAFTLIELLVVIAIITLLVSILLPSLMKTKNLTKRTLCKSQCHHIGLATNMYAQDNSAQLPEVWTAMYPYATAVDYGSPAGDLGHALLIPYCGFSKKSIKEGDTDTLTMFQCPSNDSQLKWRDVGEGALAADTHYLQYCGMRSGALAYYPGSRAKLSDLKPTDILFVDRVLVWSGTEDAWVTKNHAPGANTEFEGVNSAQGDGSALWTSAENDYENFFYAGPPTEYNYLVPQPQ